MSWKDRAKPVDEAPSADSGWKSRAVAIESAPITEPKTTAGMSALRGAAQTSSFGFGDELYGVVGAALPGFTGSTKESFADRYAEARDYARRKDLKAESDNPKSYTTGALAGGVMSGLAPGLGALNAAKGAKIGQVIGKGALTGAIAGAGSSDAAPVTNPEGLVADVAKGGFLGGAFGAGFHGAGKAIGAVKSVFKPERVSSVLLNAPQEAVELYMKNPAAVNAAKSRPELTKGLMGTMDKLKQEVIEGSAASREILSKEGATVKGSDIARILDDKADEILQRSEGVWDDPQISAAYGWLRETAKKYKPDDFVGDQERQELASVLHNLSDNGPEDLAAFGMSPRGIGGEILERKTFTREEIAKALKDEGERNLSTNRVKDAIQTMDRATDYQVSPGQFARISDDVRKGVRSRVDELLKSKSPAYRDQMKLVAGDAELLEEVSSLAGSPQALDGLLKRVQSDRAFFPAEKLGALDRRMGTDLLGDLKKSSAKEAFEKGATNGSRNVNMYSKTFGDIGRKWNLPFAETIGSVVGGTVDKYGPAIGKSIIDSTLKMRHMLDSSSSVQSLGKYGKPLLEAAKRGNKALAATHLTFMQDSDYRSRVMGTETAIQRRLQGDN